MYLIESQFVSIHSKESTQVHLENEVWQFKHDSPPKSNTNLRLDGKTIFVTAVVKQEDDKVMFMDNNAVAYVWQALQKL